MYSHSRRKPAVDPIEQIIRAALSDSGVRFSDNENARENHGLDFYLPDVDVHIEVEAGPSDTDRASRQLRQAENVILIQNKHAALWFASVLRGTPLI